MKTRHIIIGLFLIAMLVLGMAMVASESKKYLATQKDKDDFKNDYKELTGITLNDTEITIKDKTKDKITITTIEFKNKASNNETKKELDVITKIGYER